MLDRLCDFGAGFVLAVCLMGAWTYLRAWLHQRRMDDAEFIDEP